MNFLMRVLNRLPRKSTWGMVVVGAILVYLILPPLFFLVRTSFISGDTIFGTPTVGLDNFRTVLKSASTWQLLLNSLIFAVGSSVVGLTIGGTLAWIVERTNTPFRKLVYVAVFLHFATPGILRVIGWILLIGPKSGYINVLLRKFFSIQATTGPLNIFSLSGMVMIEGLMWGSLVFLLMSAPLRSMDPSLEEAAAMSGAGVLKTIWKVTLPMALPSILSVLLLAFVRCLEAFEVPALVGIPAGVHVFTTKIWFEIKRDIFPNYGIASAYSVFALVLVGFGLYLYSRATRASFKFYTITGKGYRPKVADLGKWRYFTMLIIFILPLFDLLPLLMLAWSSFLPYHMAPSFDAFSKMTLHNYESTIGSIRTLTSIKNSLIVSSVGATIATLLAMLVAWIAVRTKLRGRWFLDSMASFPLVFPGVVLGVALLKTYLTLPIPVYNTLWILIIGYIIRYLPYAMRYCHPGLLQISAELEECAFICGASWFTTFKKVLMPLMLPALFGAWIWIFLVSFRELSLSIMLSGPTTPVVAVSIFELWENGQVSEVGAFGVMLSLMLMTLSVLFHKFIKSRGVARSDQADM
jgi:iron(III) transport system permease protein